MISREDILELYVIELQPKCWSICSTLRETKMIDTPRTLCFGSAEVYRNEAIVDRHCNNIIKGGKFINAKVIPLQYISRYITLNNGVEEALEYFWNLRPQGRIGGKTHFQNMFNRVTRASANRNELINECIELLSQDGIDSKQIVANKLKELL